MNGNTDELRDFKRAQASFRERMSELWQKKHDLFGLFRTRMEQEKLHEIKQRLDKMNRPNDSLPPNRHF